MAADSLLMPHAERFGFVKLQIRTVVIPQLPELLSRDVCFIGGDKDSLCAGSHLIVSGREFTEGNGVWSWCLVPGGVEMGLLGAEVLNSAEKYNPEIKSWERLPCMHKKRKLCSGCFMDDKFYVIGGKDENDMELTCVEAYNKDKNTWELILDMLKDDDNPNELKVYRKKTNTWKKLGAVPVRADLHKGWGVAFKSLGKELLVIGYSSAIASGNRNCNEMTIYTCRPGAKSEELRWRCIEGYKDRLNFFLLNCCVMVA
ncbi:hypothetical protein like AT3G27150 [Hibiscus trionum]|uniref:F-box/kelch-repeat protein n=1 Tax=Hibiscus trionum TaxID=183268 RepID=A0A9W7GZE4_HIBTR|nr:hypothetical protein like AT3G27150 [Hibiscus trionum]